MDSTDQPGASRTEATMPATSRRALGPRRPRTLWSRVGWSAWPRAVAPVVEPAFARPAAALRRLRAQIALAFGDDPDSPATGQLARFADRHRRRGRRLSD